MTSTPTTELVFLDTETTHLNPEVGEILEVAYTYEYPDSRIFSYVLPHTLRGADANALRVNQYWQRGLDHQLLAKPDPDVLRVIAAALAGRTIVAENYGFDCAWLTQLLGFEPWSYRKIELSSVAMTVFDLDRPESQHATAGRLRDLGYRIPEGDHSAAADVACLRACYLALRAHQTALLAGRSVSS